MQKSQNRGRKPRNNTRNHGSINYGRLPEAWKQAHRDLKDVRKCDYHRLKRDLDHLIRKSVKPEELSEDSKDLNNLASAIRSSQEEKQRRRLRKPKYNWNHDLPITACKDEIIKTIRDNQVVVLAGETGKR